MFFSSLSNWLDNLSLLILVIFNAKKQRLNVSDSPIFYGNVQQITKNLTQAFFVDAAFSMIFLYNSVLVPFFKFYYSIRNAQ